MIITGNKNEGVSSALATLYPDAEFISRSTGYDFGKKVDMERCAEAVIHHDVFINCSALFRFNQTSLLDIVYKKCILENHQCHIINIGSTTDRVKKGGAWLYNAEKKALRDFCNSLGIHGVWGYSPLVTLISFGSLSNVQDKHPDRKCMPIAKAAEYIHWLLKQPADLHINEISIDPLQY